MRRPQRIIFINRFYRPDEQATAQLLRDLAEGLAALGHHVTVIASQPSPGRPGAEVLDGVRVLRVSSPCAGRRGAFSRIPALVGFLRGALRLLDETARTGDIVVPLTDPPLLGCFVQRRARARGARVVHWVQDIYPEIAMALGRIPGPGLLRRWRDRTWQGADACVTLGRDMAAFMMERRAAAPRIQPNWAPAGLAPADASASTALRTEWGIPAASLVVMYSGNLGRVHDLAPVIALAERLRNESGITFVFAGSGAHRAFLEAEAQKHRLASVRFLPHQPRERLAAVLSAGDVHLVTLHSACARFVYPSKIHGIAAVGRPMLFIGPPACDIARDIVSQNIGAVCARDEIEAMAGALVRWRDDPALRHEQGAAASAAAERNGGAARAVGVWDSLINGLAPPRVSL